MSNRLAQHGGTLSRSVVRAPVICFVLAAALGLPGCVLFHDGENTGGGGSGSVSGSGISAVSASASTGSGGAGGTGGEPSVCPSKDFTLDLSSPEGAIGATKAVVSQINGHTTIAGFFTAPVSIGMGELIVEDISAWKNFYLLTLDEDGKPQLPHSIATTGSPILKRVIATTDGGSAVALVGGPNIRVNGLNGANHVDLVGNNDQAVTDGIVVKLSPDGAVDWVIRLEAGASDLTIDLLTATPTGLLVGGSTLGEITEKKDLGVVEEVAPERPRLFLLEYDLQGQRLGRHLWPPDDGGTVPGAGTLVATREMNGSRYLFGTYRLEFPDFSNGDGRPSFTATDDLFVVKLDPYHQTADLQSAFGFPGRSDQALEMLDTGDGLAIFASVIDNPPGTNEATFIGHTTKLPANRNATLIAKLSYDLDVQWVTTHRTVGLVYPHSAGPSAEGGFILGHLLGSAPLPGSLGIFQAPATDTVLLKISADGKSDRALAFSALEGNVMNNATADFRLEESACGSLIYGFFNGNTSVAGYTAKTSGYREHALIAFRKSGIPFTQ